jgi:hypothetical protein
MDVIKLQTFQFLNVPICWFLKVQLQNLLLISQLDPICKWLVTWKWTSGHMDYQPEILKFISNFGVTHPVLQSRLWLDDARHLLTEIESFRVTCSPFVKNKLYIQNSHLELQSETHLLWLQNLALRFMCAWSYFIMLLNIIIQQIIVINLHSFRYILKLWTNHISVCELSHSAI